ncbi:hypothetical protein ACIBQX_43650 [Nonomuraea sp. NPDC049714]|uniref:hypothetical protein n=1 Tax=Nonomuraea sp. NPDC049714 TaxID=3364357 RepID=UPI0037B63EB1
MATLRRFPDELVAFIEGLAPRGPRPQRGRHPPEGRKHRRGARLAVAPYRTVARIVADLDPALVTLGLEGTKKYREIYDLVYRREAKGPTRSGRPTTPSWTSGRSTTRADRPGRG